MGTSEQRLADVGPIANRQSKLNIKNKVLLYKMIRAVMTYAAPVGVYARATLINRLQVVQNRREATNAL